jgi:hypothetical protein
LQIDQLSIDDLARVEIASHDSTVVAHSDDRIRQTSAHDGSHFLERCRHLSKQTFFSGDTVKENPDGVVQLITGSSEQTCAARDEPLSGAQNPHRARHEG